MNLKKKKKKVVVNHTHFISLISPMIAQPVFDFLQQNYFVITGSLQQIFFVTCSTSMHVKLLAKGKQHGLKGVMRCYFCCCYFEFIRSEFRFVLHRTFKQLQSMSNPCEVSGPTCRFKIFCVNILQNQAFRRAYVYYIFLLFFFCVCSF